MKVLKKYLELVFHCQADGHILSAVFHIHKYVLGNLCYVSGNLSCEGTIGSGFTYLSGSSFIQ